MAANSKESQKEEIQQVDPDQQPAEKSPEELLKEQQERERAGLYGDTARRLYDESIASEAPNLKKSLLKQAIAASEAYIREAEAQAVVEPWAKIPNWMANLPLPPQPKILLGRIYSFTSNGHPCHMMAEPLGQDAGEKSRSHTFEHLAKMVDAGYLIKQSNGRGKPATYTVNVARCIEAARGNGWEPVKPIALVERRAKKKDAPKNDSKETTDDHQKDA